MKSQEDMNQLNHQNEQNLHRQKGKAGLGYKEEGETSKQGTQKPTCNHCDKLGHTSNKCWSNGKEKFNGKCYNCSQHVHKANECKEKPKFEGNCHKCKNMVIRHSNANPNHSIQLNNLLKLYFDGTTIPGADVTIVENMDILA